MKNLVLFIGLCLMSTFAFAQASYSVSGPINGQGPLLNTESTSSSTGWTQIHLDTDHGGGSVNSWSDAVDIGFPFEFYGTAVDSFCVSKNYLLTFNTSVATTTLPASIDTNSAMPYAGLPDSTIAYFWGTFANGSAPLGTNDDVWTKTFGTAPNRQLWIKNFSYEAEAQSFTYNFLVLEETTNKFYVVDARNATTSVGTRSVGVQLDGTTAVEHPSSPNIASINGNTTTPWPNVDRFEFTPIVLVANNASVTALTNPVSPFCAGTDSMVVEVTNVGTNTITSVTVNSVYDGVVQPPVVLTGLNLAPNASINVNTGNFTFVTGNLYDFEFYTSLPNNVPDGDPSDDTLNVIDAQTGLTGAYTINSAVVTGGTNFQTFADATSTLEAVGVCGAVDITVVVGSGPYNEQVLLNEVIGTSSTNTITFKGNLETLTATPNSTDRYIFKLDGAQWVTIDSLKLVSTSVTYGWGVTLTGEANFNTISNCEIDLSGITSTSSSNSAGIVSTASTTSLSTGGNNANWTTITNNDIDGGYYGIRLNGSTGGQDAQGNHIEGNEIHDFYAYGVYLDDNDSSQVIENDISRANRVTVTTFYGVFLTAGNRDIDIEGNSIHNTHDNASSLTGATYPIYFSSCDAPIGQENRAINNLIYNLNSNGTIYGIYNSSSNGAYYYHNTLSIDHTTATGGTTRGFYQTTTADDIDFRNNIISITRGGTGTKHGIYLNSTGSTIISDYNVIYVNSAGSGAQHVGRYGSTDYTTLTNWQTANSGAYGQNSEDVDPLFTDILLDNYTPKDTTVNDMGTNLFVTEDIFGAVRDTLNPDPGAIEFTPLSFTLTVDSAITCNGFSDGVASASVSGGNPGYSYNWSNGDTTSSIFNIAAGTYYLTVTDSIGCTAIDSIIVDEPTAVVATISVDSNVSCNGLSDGGATATVVGGTPGYTYAWSSGGITSSETGLMAGTFTLIVSDTNNCIDTAEVIISEPALLVLTIDSGTISDALCAGDSNGSGAVIASGGTAPYAYAWPSGATTANEINLSAGMYTVSVTDSNGCADTAVVTIDEPAPITMTLVAIDAVCEGGSDGAIQAQPIGGVMPYSYQWNDPMAQTTNPANGLAEGTYTVIVTDSNGCTGEDSATVGFSNPLPVVSIVASADSVCEDSVIVLDAGAGLSAYSWSNGDTTQTSTVNATGTYVVTVTDANGCQNSDSASVIVSGVCVGIDEIFNNAIVKYYPNPTNGQLNIEIQGLEGKNLNIEILNVQGQVIYRKSQNRLNDYFLDQVDLSTQSAGIYLVRLTTEGQSTVNRVSVR